MVFHDWELDRLTDETGLVEERSRDELEATLLSQGEEAIPSLATFLDLIAGTVPLLIEIKSKPGYNVAPSCRAVADALSSYHGECAVMSFDPRVADWFHIHFPDVALGLVMREDAHGDTQTQELRDAAFEQASPDFLAYHIAALPNPWVTRLRANGLAIASWTVNSAETRARALDCVDALIAEGAGLA